MPITEKIIAGLSLILASTAMVFLAIMFYINPKVEAAQKDLSSASAYQLVSAKTVLSELFNNQGSRYIIQYPANWQYDKSQHGILVMNGKEGTSSHSSINIQTIHTKKTGGQFANVDQFISALKKQNPNVKVLESGPIALMTTNGQKLEGQYSVSTFKNDGTSYKQWQVIVMRGDAQVFYTWEFISPKNQFLNDLPIAQAVLSSWQIY